MKEVSKIDKADVHHIVSKELESIKEQLVEQIWMQIKGGYVIRLKKNETGTNRNRP